MSQTWEDYLLQQENVDGQRWTWNILPHSKTDAHALSVPIVAFTTPLKERPAVFPQQPVLEYAPLLCQKASCKAVISPIGTVDFRGKVWICALCSQRNTFPAHYAAATEENMPPELYPQFTTIEYTLPRAMTSAPVFIYVVDTCIATEEIDSLKETLQKSLSLLPADAIVGLITYGRMVQLHDLSAQGIARSYIFRGTKEITQKQLKDALAVNATPSVPNNAQGVPQRPAGPPQAQAPGGVVNNQPMPMTAAPVASNKFLQPIGECDESINNLIDQIREDKWPVPQGHRPLRATGAAISAAVGLLEACYPNSGARILTFVGGACNNGPGAVVGEELKTPIRSWHSIKEEKAPFMKKATKFYDSLASRAIRNGHTIDLYSCALDQTGLMEMRHMYQSTGGIVVMGDSFKSSLFRQTFQRTFDKNAQGHLKMGLNATMEVKTGPGLRVQGILGNCSSGNVKNACVSDAEIGIGQTCQWKFSSLTPRTTVGVVLEVSAPHKSTIRQGGRAVVQFVTQYQHADGRKRIRVTTTCRTWADMSSAEQSIAYGFDQEAGAVAIARLASWRASVETNTGEVLRWVDRSLVRLCQKFGTYQREDPASFTLNAKFSLFPQFLFHLRRSQFLQVFNNSPDETAYYRHTLFGENVLESTTMIQPVLFSYSFSGPPEPVLLDTSSILPDRILLMDDYFHVLIYHGQTIAAWRKMNYQNDPQYATFKQLLEAPVADATEILSERYPVPRYIVTEYEGSQARFLLSKVNPSLTHNNFGSEGGAPVFTDDVSLQVFMEHLKKLASSCSN